MNDILGYFITFICTAVGVSLYFVMKRKEPANENPILQITKNIQLLMKDTKKNKEDLDLVAADFHKQIAAIRKDIEQRDFILRSEHLDLKTHVSSLSPYHRVLVQMPGEKKKKPLMPKEKSEPIPEFKTKIGSV